MEYYELRNIKIVWCVVYIHIADTNKKIYIQLYIQIYIQLDIQYVFVNYKLQGSGKQFELCLCV